MVHGKQRELPSSNQAIPCIKINGTQIYPQGVRGSFELVRTTDQMARFLCSTRDIRYYANTSYIPNCVGLIDGSHIRLQSAPNGDRDHTNGKGYFSIQLQMICDDKCIITDTCVGWQGCTHDARVFRNSQIYDSIENGNALARDKYIIHCLTMSLYHLEIMDISLLPSDSSTMLYLQPDRQ